MNFLFNVNKYIILNSVLKCESCNLRWLTARRIMLSNIDTAFTKFQDRKSDYDSDADSDTEIEKSSHIEEKTQEKTQKEKKEQKTQEKTQEKTQKEKKEQKTQKDTQKETLVVSEVSEQFKKKLNISNRGTGAGGSNTNKNGLEFERNVDLKKNYTILSTKNKINKIKFNGTDTHFIEVPKKKLQKYMKSKNKMNTTITIAHGCKEPDEAYIDENKKIIFIIEKKFQQVGGSVCEKLQTAVFKREHYRGLFPEYTIEYIYCLSDWFIKNCKAEIQFLNKNNFKIFFGKTKQNIDSIINYITNY